MSAGVRRLGTVARSARIHPECTVFEEGGREVVLYRCGDLPLPHRGEVTGGWEMPPGVEAAVEAREGEGEAPTVTDAFTRALITLPHSKGREGMQSLDAGGLALDRAACWAFGGHPLRPGLGAGVVGAPDVEVEDSGIKCLGSKLSPMHCDSCSSDKIRAISASKVDKLTEGTVISDALSGNVVDSA